MEERDAMAGPAVGIVRNPFRYGEDITERKGKFVRNCYGQPIKKMWRVITNDEVLAMTLSQFVCYHPPGIHARIEGQTSRDSALYSEQLAEIIATAWYGDDPAEERTAESISSANETNEDESGSDASTRNVGGAPGGQETSRDRVE